jgi:hypothetical protein
VRSLELHVTTAIPAQLIPKAADLQMPLRPKHLIRHRLHSNQPIPQQLTRLLLIRILRKQRNPEQTERFLMQNVL